MTFCLCIGLFLLVLFPRLTLSVTISAFFRIEFWPAWLSPRMRLSSPDHSPLIARTRVLAICSFCRFSSYNTASGRFYQPGETFMTHLTYSGLCCFFFFLSADRPLQRLRGCFLGDNAAVPPAYRVKVEKCASFVDILDVCKFTTFCDRKG